MNRITYRWRGNVPKLGLYMTGEWCRKELPGVARRDSGVGLRFLMAGMAGM